jgi:hypothetical protein
VAMTGIGFPAMRGEALRSIAAELFRVVGLR